MNASTIFAHLRNLLAELYEDVPSARRIVTDADLDASRIAFSTRALDTWDAILTEATKVRKVEPLLHVILQEYPDHEQLRAACQAYHALLAQGGDPLADDAAPAPG